MKNLLFVLLIVIVSTAWARTTLAVETMAGDACNSAQTGWVRFSGGPEQDPPQQIRCDGSYWVAVSASGGLLDRIVSGTQVVSVNQGSGTVSLTTNGADWGYLRNSGNSYIPALQTTAVVVSSSSPQVIYNNGTVSAYNGLLSGSSGYYAGTVTSNRVQIFTSNTTRLTIDGGGNVGIGTGSTLPSTTLHVMSDSGFRLQASSNGRFIDFAPSGANIDISNTAGGVTPLHINRYNNNPLLLNSGGGNVGIGVFSNLTPSATLHVSGTGIFSGYVGIGTTNVTVPLHVYQRTLLGTSVGASATIATFQDNVGNQNYITIKDNRHTAGSDWNGVTTRLQRFVDSTPMGFIDFGISGLNASYGISFGSGTSTSMVIRNDGDVGIGKTNPGVELDVSGSIQYTGSIADISDRRLKAAVKPWKGSALEKLALMKPITFEMKNLPGVTEYGFIAQDVQPIFPELVLTAKDASKTMSMNYVGMVAPMVKAIQELKVKNDHLQKDNAEMKRQLAALCKATKACQ